MPDFSDPQRWVIPAILVVSLIGTALAVWWERLWPTSYTQKAQQDALEAAGVGSMEDWHRLPTIGQEVADACAIAEAAAEQAGEDAVWAAREAAREAAERAAAQTHSLYRS